MPINVSAVLTQFSNFGAAGDFIRVDDSTNTGQAIGQIQVSNANVVSSIVSVFVADSSRADFPTDARDNSFFLTSSAAGATLAGVSLDTNSANRVRLAAVVTGDVTGDVTVGEVFTLRSLSGRIRGNVVATQSESSDLSDSTDDAIKFVYAQDGLGISGTTKTINASGSNGTIKKILVGPKFNASGNEIAFGIDADVKAESGLIDNIESSGPIGVSRRVDIKGGYGVQFLTCKATENGVTVARNVRANVKANVLAAPTNDDDRSQHGRIYQMRVSGDITSDSAIESWMLRAPTYPEGDPNGETYGIFVDGDVNVPIIIKKGVLTASILARSFSFQPTTSQPYSIDIGGSMKGRVIATGTNGQIPAIGIGTDATQSTRGFIASVHRPVWDMSPPGGSCDDESFDEPQSVVRASSIGLFYSPRVATNIGSFTRKCYVPRIESPSIGAIFVDALDAALIWSGDLVAMGTNGPDRTDSGVHANIGTAEFGAVGSAVEIFVDDFTRFDVLGDCAGTIRMPQLRDNDVLRIGCSLTSFPGYIDLRDNNSLHGYIIMHASLEADGTTPCNPIFSPWECGDFETPWNGQIRVGNVPQTTDAREFDRFQTSESGRRSPCYGEVSSNLGSGAMGVAPYHLHAQDCVPPLASLSTPAALSQLAFGGVSPFDPTPIKLKFYGRVFGAASPTNSSVRVQMFTGTNPDDDNDWTDVAGWIFNVVVPTAAAPSREVRIAVREVGYPARRLSVPRGLYRVKPLDLRCADTFASSPSSAPPVADFEYRFCIVKDCEPDGLPDVACGDSSACTTPPSGQCVADCDNGDGNGTIDGGVTIEDLLYYLTIFESGSPYADLDDGTCNPPTPDGGVTIEDLLCFLTHFEAGC